jgi:hypothetical protein
MNIDRTRIRAGVSAVALLLLMLDWTGQVHGQGSSSGSVKFDEFEDLKTDDIQARLDLFSKKLRNDEQLVGLIVGYRREYLLPGEFLREIHGFSNYLVNSLGVDPKRISVSDAGVRTGSKTELWLMTAAPSYSVSPETVSKDQVTHFDQLTMGPDCESEYTLLLEQPGDAVKFFGEALQRNPTTRGYVLAHPSKDMDSKPLTVLLTTTRDSLRNEYGIAADRISTAVELRRACASIDLWLAPANLSPAPTDPLGLFFYSKLMAEAERNDYAVRRIELVGNTCTRDNVIRRRLVQDEGDTFRRELLERSLSNVSKLKHIDPVSLRDVEVTLNHEDKSIDFLINLTDRSRSRRRVAR